MKIPATLYAALLLLPAASARAAETGVGAAATAGTGGYRRLAAYVDANWTGGRVEPYAWGEGAVSRSLRQVSAGGGFWNNWTAAERGKAGLGFVAGRYDDGRGASSLIAELGAEKDVADATLGAGWRLTYGTLSNSRGAPSLESSGASRSRGRRATDQDYDSFAVNELTAYGRRRLDSGVLGLSLGLEFPSGGSAIVCETLSFRIPAGARVSVTPAVTLEQGGSSAAYVSLGVYCRL